MGILKFLKILVYTFYIFAQLKKFNIKYDVDYSISRKLIDCKTMQSATQLITYYSNQSDEVLDVMHVFFLRLWSDIKKDDYDYEIAEYVCKGK